MNRIDWLNFALEVLMKKGPEFLRIGPLCEQKGVTKGSFYHHFKNRAEFIDALMSHWYEKVTLAFIEQANTQATALQRLEELDRVIAAEDIEAENHIRAWALKEPNIGEHLAKIDSKRQAYLCECYIELGLDPDFAKDVALMAYANFLGMQQIHPRPRIEDALRIAALGPKTMLSALGTI